MADLAERQVSEDDICDLNYPAELSRLIPYQTASHQLWFILTQKFANNPEAMELMKPLKDANGLKAWRVVCRDSQKFTATELMEEQPGEKPTPWMSLYNHPLKHQKQLSCFITRTNKNTHKIIKENTHLSAMYSGKHEVTARV